jgi:hypothetical protein
LEGHFVKNTSFANLMAFSVACVGALFALFVAPRIVLQLYRIAHPGVEPMTLFEDVLVFPTLQIGLVYALLGAGTGAGFVLAGTPYKVKAFLLFLIPSVAVLSWLSAFPEWGAIPTVPNGVPTDYPRPDYRHFAQVWCSLMLAASILVLLWHVLQRLFRRNQAPAPTAAAPAPVESVPGPPAESARPE